MADAEIQGVTKILQLLDPLFDYLSYYLPPTVLTLLESLIANTFTFAVSLFNLFLTLIANSPSRWDAEKILPPLITLLLAYLALLSFYRTTKWMVSIVFAFMKWGFLLSMLAGGAGYLLANAHNNDGGGGLRDWFTGAGILPTVGGMIYSILTGNGSGNNPQSGGGRRRRGGTSGASSYNTRSSSSRPTRSRPNAWDTWDRHQQWQYNQDAAQGRDDGGAGDIQKIIGDILGTAGRYVKDSGIWEAAKGFVDEVTAASSETREERSRRESSTETR